MNHNGQLIVIEGGDGSGKTTQAALLIKHLQKQNKPVLSIDFPQYDQFFGKIVARFLRGEFGSIDQTSPFLISIIYALDRSSLRDKIRAHLDKGGFVISNRYTTSNLAHQTANIDDEQKQKEFFTWIQELEYVHLKIPKEDRVIYLYVPWQIGMRLSEEKLIHGNHHEYLEGKFDILEKNIQHRKDTEKAYLHLCKINNHWVKIDCVNDKGKLLNPGEIHKKILAVLKLN